MDEQVLNKKLAEWAEIRYVKHTVQVCGQMVERYEWHYPDGSFHFNSPDFPNDLNACFKWLVPKLDKVKIILNEAPSGDVFWNAQANDAKVTSETPALALCLAIEKLIK